LFQRQARLDALERVALDHEGFVADADTAGAE
jgi:hypothetical protein